MSVTFESNTVTAHEKTSAVTGLSAVLRIIIFGVILAVCVLFISFVKRKPRKTSHTPTKQGMCRICSVFKTYPLNKEHLLYKGL